MCKECGCGTGGEVQIGNLTASSGDPANHGAGQPHDHFHPHPHPAPALPHRVVPLVRAVLEKNDRLAERNRGFFRAKRLLVMNVLSAPGSGKTTFIQRTAEALSGRLRVGVIVGDLATENDANRLRQSGIPVVQVTTGTICHLEAAMVAQAADRLPLDDLDVVIIENVGNLVCPADFDLGEELRVVLLSTTEGEDKPLKYPPMFHSAHVAVITKMDLAEAAGFDLATARENVQRIAHHAVVFEVSAKSGQGMEAWLDQVVGWREKARH